MPYLPRRAPQLERLKVRGLEFQLYRWPAEDPRPLVLVHGWGDTGETFQFLVDRLSLDRTVIAFDCRGFGRTEWPQDGYWFPDYLADLDAILDRIAPLQQPVDLLGHSMGGNIVALYAGIRPGRARRLVSLEGFGMQRTTPDQAPARYRQWLDELKQGAAFTVYDSFEHFAQVLTRRNPRTKAERIEFITRSWGRQRDDGRVELRADPRHKLISAMLYQREQAEACWRAITAPLLFVLAGKSSFVLRYAEELSDERLRALFSDVTPVTVPEAGHMLHHECPEQVAELVERFLRERE